MAINKSNTSPAMKAVLIALIIVFVVGFVSIGTLSLFTGTGATDTTGTGTATDVVSAINQKYQPTVAAISQSLQSEPESYTALVNLGNAYFDWAAQMQEASQANTSAVGADQPLWTSAKDAYARAVAVNDKESSVRTDYAITLFYTGDTNKAISIVTDVTKDDPKFPYSWFNLGIFKRALGENDAALAAYRKAISLDPKGEKINLNFVKQQVKELEAASSAATSTP